MYFYFSKEKAQTGEKFIECYYCVPANGDYKPTSPHLSRPWIVLLRYPERVKCFNWVFGSQLRANVDPLPVKGTQLIVSLLTIHILITCATTLHEKEHFYSVTGVSLSYLHRDETKYQATSFLLCDSP